MLKTFALIAVLHGNAYVVDFDLSAQDCAIAMETGVSTIWIDSERFISAEGARLTCEVESE